MFVHICAFGIHKHVTCAGGDTCTRFSEIKAEICIRTAAGFMGGCVEKWCRICSFLKGALKVCLHHRGLCFFFFFFNVALGISL